MWANWTCNSYIFLHICTHDTTTNASTQLLFELRELGRWGKQHTNTYTLTTPPPECFITLETEAWFICSQIKATEVDRVEKIIPGKQEKKSLKPPINNMKRVLFMKAASRLIGIHTGV